ncbi:hypothetical protein Q0590_02275 [Rhodocytophaga aerolata]|uniref:Universal stress protein n=1 Tax=Rhodocytophaga aerolata TaxID=455078 RepID=A0ABT8QYY8_9BACT|nr:hypothetical protein [Rhodocytophaga aerolata]MDO1445055.1 hypothetical protein [Rhodocytophaga aerolata]
MKTIYVPTSPTHNAASAFKFATCLASKMPADVHVYPLENEAFALAEQYGGFIEKIEALPLSEADYRLASADVNRTTSQAQKTHRTRFPCLEADLMVIDAAFVRGKYKLAMKAEHKQSSGSACEFMMDDFAEGTKGACAAHELPLHPEIETLLLQTHCPVLTVAHSPKTAALNTVVFVTDGEEGPQPLVTLLAQLQRIFMFKLHLLHINRYFHRQPVIQVMNTMRELANSYSLINYQLHVVEEYTYEAGIIHFLKAVHPDMLALPIDGHKIISRLLEEFFTDSPATTQVPYLLSYKL